MTCKNCKIVFGEYYCEKCKYFDNDTSKEQFHCDECGICRVGGRENYFHCETCGCCLPHGLKDKHKCLQNTLKSECPICLEDMMHMSVDS